jgi:hypothetical protein
MIVTLEKHIFMGEQPKTVFFLNTSDYIFTSVGIQSLCGHMHEGPCGSATATVD